MSRKRAKNQNHSNTPVNRVFVDTAYIQALLNPRDQYHAKALELSHILQNAEQVVTTEFVLLEVGDAMSAIAKQGAIEYIDNLYTQDDITIIEIDRTLYRRGLGVYRQYEDKEWGLTDCISFVIMWDNNLTDALATDQHFVQAGFRALMRDD
jgi:uncharacterized protein